MTAYWLIVLLALPAHADLYRWIDPDSGSVKLSSSPPADPRIHAEIVTFKAPAAPKPPPAAVATSTTKLPAPAQGSIPELESRLRSLIAQLSGATPQDFDRGAEGLKQHMDAYEAVRNELDRLDPAGAARRNVDSASMFDRIRQGFAAQFGTKPPAPTR